MPFLCCPLGHATPGRYHLASKQSNAVGNSKDIRWDEVSVDIIRMNPKHRNVVMTGE
jgi:hypothetical protein